jgi:hypothetical protein
VKSDVYPTTPVLLTYLILRILLYTNGYKLVPMFSVQCSVFSVVPSFYLDHVDLVQWLSDVVHCRLVY